MVGSVSLPWVNPMGLTKAKRQTATTNTTMTTHQEATASSHGPEQPSLQKVKDEILQALEDNGGRMTKDELINKFFQKYGKDLYYKAEQDLVDDKIIERRRGRKGGRYLVQQDDSQSQTDPEPSDSTAEESSPDRENYHYKPVIKQIQQHWTDERDVKHVYVALTAHPGSVPTGGRWSRPDITLCTVSEWIFSSRPEGEVTTIEVKVFNDQLDIVGVHEALAHKSRSHYSYLMIVKFRTEKLDSEQEEDFDKIRENYDRIRVAAASHGIGIITVPDSNDWSTWKFPLEPTRSDADRQEINEFLLNQFPEDERNLFTNKIRQIDGGQAWKHWKTDFRSHWTFQKSPGTCDKK